MRTPCLWLVLLLLGCPSAPRSDAVDVPRLGDDDDSRDDDDDDVADDDNDAADDDDDVADDDDDVADDDDDVADDDDDATPVVDGPGGWIGAPCASDADCAYDGGRCLLDGEGFPRGTCSLGCDLYCPDAQDRPVSFCTSDGDLPVGPPLLGDGACLSRCDFGVFPATGCRPDYGCRVVERANEPSTQNYACLPGDQTDLTACQLDLAGRGISFEPTIRGLDHPSGHPELDCLIDSPVWLLSPVFGVELRNTDGVETPRVLAGCPLAHAIADSVQDVLPWSLEGIRHIGTYNCRVIANSNTLSQHGLANAIDIYGFDFSDGTLWTLVDDWEHDTEVFSTDAAQWLHDTAYRWNDEQFWNVILTPNYNSGHDNHFHVDLTTGSDFIGLGPLPWDFDPAAAYWIGPAPYDD